MANLMFSFNKSKFLNQLNVRQFFLQLRCCLMVSNYMQMKQLLNAFIISMFMCVVKSRFFSLKRIMQRVVPKWLALEQNKGKYFNPNRWARLSYFCNNLSYTDRECVRVAMSITIPSTLLMPFLQYHGVGMATHFKEERYS